MEADGPLGHTWERVARRMRRGGKINEVQLAMLRLMFFYGARCAIKAASAGPVSTVLMSCEIRDFERKYVRGMHETGTSAQGGAPTDRCTA